MCSTRARSGESATLALVGEPGIGKTALLDHAGARASGMQVLRARGIESEAQIPFASLLELLRPALGALDRIPQPQARGARGRARAQAGPGPGAVRGRRSDAQSARQRTPSRTAVAVLVDDAHWLDGPSAEALLFAVRRLVADPIAVLVAVREGEPSLLDGADLPTIRIGGLNRE